jgi:ATP-dependent Lon protease
MVTSDDVHKYLGVIKYFSDVKERTRRTGVATGLAWTAVGGDILFIEATKMRGKGSLTLTGSLGDVMKESAHAALSYIRSKAKQYEIDEEFLDKYDIHIHVPAGAIPKDGPSAGVTIFTALMSLLTDRTVANDIAMTGEITLRGLVLPIGGVKEKALAAKRAGISKIILPEKNQKDLEEIPQQVRDSMQFFFAKEMDDVIKLALSRKSKKPVEAIPEPPPPPPSQQPAMA